jgi:hypothetical protein
MRLWPSILENGVISNDVLVKYLLLPKWASNQSISQWFWEGRTNGIILIHDGCKDMLVESASCTTCLAVISSSGRVLAS